MASCGVASCEYDEYDEYDEPLVFRKRALEELQGEALAAVGEKSTEPAKQLTTWKCTTTSIYNVKQVRVPELHENKRLYYMAR